MNLVICIKAECPQTEIGTNVPCVLSKQIKRVSSALSHVYPSLIHSFCFYSHPPSIYPSTLSIFVLSGGSSFLAFCQGSDARATYVALYQSRWLAVGEENTQSTANSSTYGSVQPQSHDQIHSSIHLSIHAFSSPNKRIDSQ